MLETLKLDETIKNFNENFKSNPGAIKKGQAIFKSGDVQYMPFGEGTISFIAKVSDDNSPASHTTAVQLFAESGRFAEGNCTCRPNRVDELLCKHIVAATLTIQSEMMNQTRNGDYG